MDYNHRLANGKALEIDGKVKDVNISRTAQFPLQRAEEVEELLDAVKPLIVHYIRRADEAALMRADGREYASSSENALVERCEPGELAMRWKWSLPLDEGRGRAGLLEMIQGVLQYSVNTWDQGFLDKLTASTDPIGVISELILATLNINLHVYHVSPSLTLVEKATARALASLLGLTGPNAGGVTCPGGSASNMTSLVIARNSMYPSTKTGGNGKHKLVLFTSTNAHYSIEKAAITLGLGTSGLVSVPADATTGCMIPSALRALVVQALREGKTPFYVNATAGTTVLGAYDPFHEISAICKEFHLWLHVDGSWGGAVAFSSRQRHKLAGVELADSITINPHKMLNVPVTCSFLLTNDLAVFHRANTLPAGYLFHEELDGQEFWDLADLTLQCGRKGDALKLALSWVYHGAAGLERQINHGFAVAGHLATLMEEHPDFVLVSPNPPPCLQVCFYYAPNETVSDTMAENTRCTKEMVTMLIDRGFMIDYAPGDRGCFFRVVVNCQTLHTTVEGLVRGLEEVGREVLQT